MRLHYQNLQSLLEGISANNLRKLLLELFKSSDSVAHNNPESESATGGRQQTDRDNSSEVPDAHQADETSNVHQSRGVGTQVANVHPVTINPPATQELGINLPSHKMVLLPSTWIPWPQAVNMCLMHMT